MTNRELAAVLGCSQGMASRVRQGKRLPRGGLTDLAAALDVPLTELVKAYDCGIECFGPYVDKAMKESDNVASSQ